MDFETAENSRRTNSAKRIEAGRSDSSDLPQIPRKLNFQWTLPTFGTWRPLLAAAVAIIAEVDKYRQGRQRPKSNKPRSAEEKGTGGRRCSPAGDVNPPPDPLWVRARRARQLITSLLIPCPLKPEYLGLSIKYPSIVSPGLRAFRQAARGSAS